MKGKIRNLIRFFQIKLMLAKNLGKYSLAYLGMYRFMSFPGEAGEKVDLGPKMVREVFHDLGTTYIKFGQILSERPDLLSSRYCNELENLQHSVPSFSDEAAYRIIDEEIGLEKFESIADEPMASASIAQVYRAELETGEDVVIKVRRPGIEKRVETDLNILNFLALNAQRISTRLSNLRASNFVQEFSRWTRNELDMEKEATNLQVFGENLEDRENEIVPETYPELNTEKVMVMEYLEGVKIDRKEKLEEMGVNLKKVANNAIEGAIKQALWDGFFHADLHKSNFLITEDGKIAYLDFGMMGEIDHESGEKLGLMLLYFIREDAEGITKLLEDLGHTTEGYERDKVKQAVVRKIMRVKGLTEEKQSITRQMMELFIDITDHGIYMPANHTLLMKNLITVEGIGHSIHPDFHISERYEETVEEILWKNNDPEDVMKDFGLDLLANKDLFTKIPSKINSVLEEEELLGSEETPEKGSSAIVPATLIVSSSLLFLGAGMSETFILGMGVAELGAALYLLRG